MLIFPIFFYSLRNRHNQYKNKTNCILFTYNHNIKSITEAFVLTAK